MAMARSCVTCTMWWTTHEGVQSYEMWLSINTYSTSNKTKMGSVVNVWVAEPKPWAQGSTTIYDIFRILDLRAQVSKKLFRRLIKSIFQPVLTERALWDLCTQPMSRKVVWHTKQPSFLCTNVESFRLSYMTVTMLSSRNMEYASIV